MHWSLRRWRGLLYRGRDVYRAAGALIHKLASDTWRHRFGPSYYGNVLKPQGDCGGIDEPQLPALSLPVSVSGSRVAGVGC